MPVSNFFTNEPIAGLLETARGVTHLDGEPVRTNLAGPRLTFAGVELSSIALALGWRVDSYDLKGKRGNMLDLLGWRVQARSYSYLYYA